jgi:hypothetical protein
MDSAALSEADFLCREGQPRERFVSRTVSKVKPVAAGTRLSFGGWSRWENDVSFASSAACRGSASGLVRLAFLG